MFLRWSKENGRKKKVCFSIYLAYNNQELDLNLLYYLGMVGSRRTMSMT